MNLSCWFSHLAMLIPIASGSAQTVIEVLAPTRPMNTIDMDRAGASGPTQLAHLIAAAEPAPAELLALSFVANGGPAGIYDTGTQNGRALALDRASGSLHLIDAPLASYRAADLELVLAQASTAIGIGVGDWGGAVEVAFFAGDAWLATVATSNYSTPGPKFFEMQGASFDRVEVRVALGGNWVLTDLAIEARSGLFPEFTATPITGPAPLTVNFQDQSVSSYPGGIKAWAWDFENDGIIDAGSAHASWTYTQCGDYSVRLDVFDAQHGWRTLIKPAYVRVDPLEVAFEATTESGCAPLIVQFYDRSLGGATSWEWDFDDDGIVDSVSQHPLHRFTQQDTSYDVRLTVRSACRSQGVSVLKRKFIRTLGALTTTFDANGGGSVGGAVYFDLTTRSPLIWQALETHFDAPLGTPVGVSIYVTAEGGSAFGSETQSSAWTLIATDDGQARSAGAGQPTRVDLISSIALERGTRGVALVAQGDGHRYTSSTTVPAAFDSPFLAIQTGSASNRPFQAPVFATRTWNGTVLFCLACHGSTTERGAGCRDASGAELMLFGVGCADLEAPLTLGFSSAGASAGTLAFLIMGLSDQAWLGLPLPLALDPFGAPSCRVYSSQELSLGPFAVIEGALSFPIEIPADPLLVAVPSFWQAYTLDPLQNELGIATSNALEVVIQ